MERKFFKMHIPWSRITSIIAILSILFNANIIKAVGVDEQIAAPNFFDQFTKVQILNTQSSPLNNEKSTYSLVKNEQNEETKRGVAMVKNSFGSEMKIQNQVIDENDNQRGFANQQDYSNHQTETQSVEDLLKRYPGQDDLISEYLSP